MNEIERNKRFIQLLWSLQNDKQMMELLATMVVNDTASMQKSFEIVTSGKLHEFLETINKL